MSCRVFGYCKVFCSFYTFLYIKSTLSNVSKSWWDILNTFCFSVPILKLWRSYPVFLISHISILCCDVVFSNCLRIHWIQLESSHVKEGRNINTKLLIPHVNNNVVDVCGYLGRPFTFDLPSEWRCIYFLWYFVKLFCIKGFGIEMYDSKVFLTLFRTDPCGPKSTSSLFLYGISPKGTLLQFIQYSQRCFFFHFLPLLFIIFFLFVILSFSSVKALGGSDESNSHTILIQSRLEWWRLK